MMVCFSGLVYIYTFCLTSLEVITIDKQPQTANGDAADNLRRETNLVKRYESIKPLPTVMRFAHVSAFILADVHDRGYYPWRAIEILSLSTAPCPCVLGPILNIIWDPLSGITTVLRQIMVCCSKIMVNLCQTGLFCSKCFGKYYVFGLF